MYINKFIRLISNYLPDSEEIFDNNDSFPVYWEIIRICSSVGKSKIRTNDRRGAKIIINKL